MLKSQYGVLPRLSTQGDDVPNRRSDGYYVFIGSVRSRITMVAEPNPGSCSPDAAIYPLILQHCSGRRRNVLEIGTPVLVFLGSSESRRWVVKTNEEDTYYKVPRMDTMIQCFSEAVGDDPSGRPINPCLIYSAANFVGRFPQYHLQPCSSGPIRSN